MQDKFYDMLMQKDEITWQSLIYDLIKSEEMDPWDIDVSLLTQKYVETIKDLQEMNFFLSGKIVLASAILLKIKSNKLIAEEIPYLEHLIYPPEEEEYFDEERPEYIIPDLAIKTPQARKRTVSMNDLVSALHKALEVNHRRVMRRVAEKNFKMPEIPQKKIDISKLIMNVYQRILSFFKKNEPVTFNKLVNSDKKDDKIMTFIPLLHLDHQEKIILEQKEHFGDINILKH
ncbi:MAG: segregation/condensation protein A [Nanoarchaeota archaeon]|nr:segregation/condensation protein A [Nanoarchaeota archaeon]MCG2717810.1 segregation/condensation protein A [Nanoarchaeota archaeon]